MPMVFICLPKYYEELIVWKLLIQITIIFYLKRYMNINFKGGYFKFIFFNQIRLDFV